MFFYVTFGLTLLFKRITSSIMCTTVVLLIMSISTSNLIFLEFMLGMIVAFVITYLGITKFWKAALWIGFTLLFASIIDEVKTLFENRFIIWGIPSAFIIYGAVSAPQLKSRLCQYVGEATYSIYLIQVFSIPIFYKISVFFSADFGTDMLALFCFIATLVVGVLFYSLIEKPMTTYFRFLLIGRFK